MPPLRSVASCSVVNQNLTSLRVRRGVESLEAKRLLKLRSLTSDGSVIEEGLVDVELNIMVGRDAINGQDDCSLNALVNVVTEDVIDSVSSAGCAIGL